MAYLKSKTGGWIIVDYQGIPVTGTVEELTLHPAMVATEAYEIIDAPLPIIMDSKIIFTLGD